MSEESNLSEQNLDWQMDGNQNLIYTKEIKPNEDEKSSQEKQTPKKEERIITDPCHCCGIIILPENIEEIKKDEEIKIDSFSELSFMKRDRVKILREFNGERTLIYYKNEKLAVISNEFFDTAVNVIKAWSGLETIDVLVCEKKDSPVVIYMGRLGIAIAPRVEGGEDE